MYFKTNLDKLDADIIFVKNIDNVTTDERKADTITYKRVLAGELLRLQKRSFELLKALNEGKDVVAEAKTFENSENFKNFKNFKNFESLKFWNLNCENSQ